MIKYIIVTDKIKLFQNSEEYIVLSPEEFINMKAEVSKKGRPPRVINLSSRYQYLSKGYYVSLMAEARGHQCIPNVSNIIALEWKRNYDFARPELNAILEKTYKQPCEEPLSRTYTSFFGRHDNPEVEPVARRIFDLFRFPIVSFEVKYGQNGKWGIERIETPPYTSLIKEQSAKFLEALNKFTGSSWTRSASNKKQERYWIAILYDPNEENAPSNMAALKKFISVGKKMNLWVELITKQDFASLLEFDALLIRETTAINNHTYRFASKAEQEDIPCVDDTNSIIRCCNKVYLKELLEANDVPTPKTFVIEKNNASKLEKKLNYPIVLKVPDGSFSRGVKKVNNHEELLQKSQEMFLKSDIILCQEYVPSQFDWRIGVLNNEPLFASKYYMAKNHWQIYNNDAKSKKMREGNDEPVPLNKVPQEVLDVALASTKPIGTGLYGVDLKQLDDGRVVVIEVNDNPNIDYGVEDRVLGNKLYQKILEHLVKLIEV
ncbi:MAG: ATP-grasp domain-containing protein [Alphaproteobacteria bacterium]|nr:ATP-grasp domain-containing protein [Alphaproteobacteria bacterium]